MLEFDRKIERDTVHENNRNFNKGNDNEKRDQAWDGWSTYGLFLCTERHVGNYSQRLVAYLVLCDLGSRFVHYGRIGKINMPGKMTIFHFKTLPGIFKLFLILTSIQYFMLE